MDLFEVGNWFGVSLFLVKLRLVKVGIDVTLNIFKLLRRVIRIALVEDFVLVLILEYSVNA